LALLAGIIITVLSRDAAQKDALRRLEELVERYDGLKTDQSGKDTVGGFDAQDVYIGGGANISVGTDSDQSETDQSDVVQTEEDESAEAADQSETGESETDILLADLKAFGQSASAYPAARAWLMAGDLHHGRQEWREAREAWLAAAAKGAKTHLAPVSFFNAAAACEEEGDIEAALANYAEALKFADFPAAARAQFSIGRLNEAAGNTEAAEAAYRTVIEKWEFDKDWTNLARSRLISLELREPGTAGGDGNGEQL
jgi:tetratricopeptide (TPR) repeat protein